MNRKFAAQSKKQGEWQILREQVVQLEKLLRASYKPLGINRVRVFGYGSPRNFALVVNADVRGIRMQRRTNVDIRSDSFEFWAAKLGECDWQIMLFP